ncbi:MAG: phospholipid carrier-dependent glycosyltransferase [Propionivibrio sp.]
MANKEHHPKLISLSVLFWIVLVIFWFATLGQRALIHPDEGRYAELSLGMLQSGDWITPRLNGILYFEKPALQYWMGALGFMAFGINEFAARFWPGLTGMLSILVVGLSARRLWGSGQLAALVMAGSLWVVGNGHFLTLDAGLMFFLTLTLCAFVWAQHDGASPSERRYGMWLAWAAMAGALLSKGMIGVLIPGSALVLYTIIDRQWVIWRRMQWAAGIAIFLLLAAPWFLLVSYRNPGFASFFFIHEHFARYLTPEADRAGPIWYFIPVLCAGFLPWTSLLPRLAREAWPSPPDSARSVFHVERFLLIWAGFVFVFFSLSHSKLPSYILPMFPALAMLLGQTLQRAAPATLKRHLVLPIVVWAAFICVYPFVGRFASPDTPAPVLKQFALHLAAGGVVFLACAAFAWRFLKFGKTLPAVMLLAAGSFAAVSIASAGHDAIGQLKSSKYLVEKIRPYIGPVAPIFTIHNAYDQSLPFYLRRPVIQVDYADEFAFGQNAEPGKASPTMDEFVARWKASPNAVAVMFKRNYDELKQQGVEMKLVYEDARRLVVVKP